MNPTGPENGFAHVLRGGSWHIDVKYLRCIYRYRAKPSYRKAFAKAFRDAMTELEPKQVNLLKLRFADGLGLERIAAIYRVHHTTIHRQLRALQERLALRTRELLMGQLEIDEDDCRSVIRLIQSNFGVTLRSFFAPGRPASKPSKGGS